MHGSFQTMCHSPFVATTDHHASLFHHHPHILLCQTILFLFSLSRHDMMMFGLSLSRHDDAVVVLSLTMMMLMWVMRLSHHYLLCGLSRHDADVVV